MSLNETGLPDTRSPAFDGANPAQPQSGLREQSPAWGAKRCPSCHSPVLYNQTVCAECGTRLVPRTTKVRCRRCSKQATTDHFICPHCGRELRAAPSRLLTIGAPALLVGALAIALFARGMPSLLFENDTLPLIQNFVITPVSSDSESTLRTARESLAPAVVQSHAGQAGELSPPDVAPTEATLPTPAPTQPAEESNTAVSVAVGPTAPQGTAIPPTGTPTESAALPAAAPTETATAEAEEATATPTATLSPTPTATPTPVWKTYKIQKDDTLDAIARSFEIDLDYLLEVNDITQAEARNLVIGTEIMLPGLLQATATATPTATPRPSATATETATPRPTAPLQPSP